MTQLAEMDVRDVAGWYHPLSNTISPDQVAKEIGLLNG